VSAPKVTVTLTPAELRALLDFACMGEAELEDLQARRDLMSASSYRAGVRATDQLRSLYAGLEK